MLTPSSRASRSLLTLALLALGASCGGSSSSRSATIGVAGGSLVGPGGVLVEVPAGAVDTAFTLVISPLSPAFVARAPPF